MSLSRMSLSRTSLSPDFPFRDVLLPEVRPDGSEDNELTSPRIDEKAMVVAFRLGSGSCIVHFLCPRLFI
jgi:hypothetical protein